MRRMTFLLLMLITAVVGCIPTLPIDTEGETPYGVVLSPTSVSSPAISTSELPTTTQKPILTSIESQVPTATTIKPPPTLQYRYVPVTELTRESYVESLAWEPNGQSLAYALQGEWGPYVVPYFEPSQWNWWRYDVGTKQNTPINPSHKSAIDLNLRRKLGICAPEGVEGDECGRVPLLWESPFSDNVIYNPITDGENTWLSHKDGARSIELDGVSSAAEVVWSSDGRWAVIASSAFMAPGMQRFYLVDIHTGAVVHLAQLTGYSTTYVNYIRPRFSPNGRYLVFAASQQPQDELLSSYGLYLLDMSTLESERLTDRFGPFQWDMESEGLYVLDNAILFEYADSMLAPRKATLYHINLANKPFRETLLFEDINFFPQETPSAWHWAYSPEVQAIAMVGLQPKNELGILFLSPP